MSERQQRIERYVWEMILDGAESTIEDDQNEDGELSEAEHREAYDLAMSIVRGFKAQYLGEAPAEPEEWQKVIAHHQDEHDCANCGGTHHQDDGCEPLAITPVPAQMPTTTEITVTEDSDR